LNLSIRNPSLQRITVFLLVMALIWSLLGALVVGAAANSHKANGALAVPLGARLHQFFPGPTPPSDVACRAMGSRIPCYSPQEMRRAYGLTDLVNDGFTGKGQSIVIIDSFGSPSIADDLQVFDAGYGLPDPPLFKVLSPLGTVPFDPNNSDMVNWAFETTLDVEWAHAIAPGANIVLLTSPVSETEGVQGMPQFLFLEKYALDHHLGKIISQSWGATENTLFTPAGREVFEDFNAFYRRAASEHVTVFASCGDSGSANLEQNLTTFYPFPTVIFPASSPWVTAVGGTSLFATTSGKYQSETVWNEGAADAGGGGISQVFKEPDYQQNNLPASDQALLGGRRGIPDISYNGDPATSILVYLSFLHGAVGYFRIGGTSEGSPQWAGIIAIANQRADHPLGFLNEALYKLGNSNDAAESFHDITVGNNAQPGIPPGIPGYNSTRGWDAASGWGTPRAGELIQQLIQLEA